MAVATPLTIDDFERLPAEQAENHELVNGELIDVSGNTPAHNGIRDVLIACLYPFVRERRLGRVISEQEYDFGGNAHGPDVSFFGPGKEALVDPDKRVQRFVPDLAIEIVSANDTFGALWRKKERYRNCGTSEVWIICRKRGKF
jgi:Uma2 family endonuclease